jgi:protein-tyrosine phosphatase
MDKQNHADVLSLCTSKKQHQKINLLTKASGLNIPDVPDPYYGDEKDFDNVFDLVYQSCSAWLAKQ